MASLDHKDKEGSVNNLKLHLNHPEENDHSISRQEQSSCSSSLSSSSVESIVLENNENGVAENFESKHAHNELSTSSYSSDFTCPSSPLWSYQSASTSQNPPNQMMSQPGYDSNSIPLSIFSSSPTNPSAWSHTSNESLFSIQAGNSDFTKEHFRIGNNCVESDRFDESTRVTFEEIKDSNMVMMHCESVKTLAESSKSVLHETPSEDNSKEAIMAPREESRINNQSYQFPLLSVQVERKTEVVPKPERQVLVKPVAKPETASNNRKHCCLLTCFYSKRH